MTTPRGVIEAPRSTRLVLVGQAPGRSSGPARPIMGPSGRRLAELAGLGFPGEYEAWFERLNLLPEYPGKGSSQNDAFVLARARLAAWELFPALVGRRGVLLGRGVADAFRLGGSGRDGRRALFEWRFVCRREVRCRASGDLLRRTLDSWPAREPAPSWAARERFLAAMVPHPSGVSHWWDEREHREAAERFLRGVVAATRLATTRR